MKLIVTIKDIAKELGISKSTVSRALADQWDVNAETRKLVLETAKRMNYQPNMLAQHLIQGNTKTIGLVVPEFHNSFFTQVIIGIQNILHKEGYLLLITQSNESAEVECQNIKMLKSNRVDGLIISITSQGNHDFYQEILDEGIPIIFFNRICESIKAPRVVIEDRKMTFLATEHLIDVGCKNIAYLSGPENLSISNMRKQGYIDALVKHNLEVDENLIVTAGLQQADGETAMLSLLDKGIIPDAVFGFNDPVALGAMRVIKQRGYKIPDDIAVMGFSESRSATLVEPQLTTTEQPLAEIGETVAQLMLKKLNNRYIEHQTVYLEAHLNIRESTQKKH